MLYRALLIIEKHTQEASPVPASVLRRCYVGSFDRVLQQHFKQARKLRYFASRQDYREELGMSLLSCDPRMTKNFRSTDR